MSAQDLFDGLPMAPLDSDGLGLPPLSPPPPPPQAPAGMDGRQKWLQIVAGALAAGLGPGKGTGLLHGLNTVNAEQEQRRRQEDAARHQMYQQQRGDWEQQARAYQQELDARQTRLQQTVTSLRTIAPTLKSKDEYDRYVEAYANGLQSLGYRVDGNYLRKVVPYSTPSVEKQAQAALEQANKNPYNVEIMKHPELAAKVIVKFDKDGDGIPEDVSLPDLHTLAGMPLYTDGNGQLMPIPGGSAKAEDKANADGIFEELIAKAQAEGKNVTDPDLRRTLKIEAIKLAKEAADLAPDPHVPARDRFSIQPVTNLDGTTSIIRVNLETGAAQPVALPTGVAGAGRPNESEGKTAEFYPRVIESNKNATAFEARLARFGPQLDVELPNLLRSEQGQLYKQAQDEFINAGLRDESGAAIQPSEYDRYRGIYFVMLGDKAPVIAQKQKARQRIIEGLKLRAGNLGRGVSSSAPAPPVPSPGIPSYQDYLNRQKKPVK